MSVPKRFGILRLVGTLLKVLAWIVLVVAILIAIGVVVAGAQLMPILGTALGPDADPAAFAGAGGIIVAIMSLVVGLIYFLLLYAAGESMHLQVALEENTRLTAALLLRMHQESQVEAEPEYTPGFANEPFENR